MISSPARFCTISGYVVDASGEALDNRFVRVRILDGVDAIVGRTAISSSPTSVYTDTDGSFEFVLPRGALARIEIPESGLDASFNVPMTQSAALDSLSLRTYYE